MDRDHLLKPLDGRQADTGRTAVARRELRLDIERLEERIAPAYFSDISFTIKVNKATPILF